MNSRRLGRFYVADVFMNLENITTRRLMEQIIPLDVRYDPAYGNYRFLALSDQFDEVEGYCQVPEYDVIIGGDPVFVRFVRKVAA